MQLQRGNPQPLTVRYWAGTVHLRFPKLTFEPADGGIGG
jgi:hypothetical protein